MNKFDLEQVARSFRQGLRKRSPEILMGIGIGGFFTSIGLAVWATPEALRRIEKRKKELREKRLNAVETVRTAGVCYLPAAVTSALSTACVIGSGKINSRRNAALATAYTISEAALREYRGKVIEAIGERKEKAIQDEIDRDRVEKNPPPKDQETLLAEGMGQTLCYDAMFGRYFYSDRAKIERAENKLNRQMATMSEPYISLNEFYIELGLPPVEIGDAIGWNVDRGQIDIRFSSQLAQGRIPCLVMTHQIPPEYNYF